MKRVDLLTKDKRNDDMCGMLGKKERRDTLSPSLDVCHATDGITNYLWNGVWIVEPVRYLSKDIQQKLASRGKGKDVCCWCLNTVEAFARV